MFSRDDSDRRPRVWPIFAYGIGFDFFSDTSARLANLDFGIAALISFLLSVVFVALGIHAINRIRRRLSRPDEHETAFVDRVG